MYAKAVTDVKGGTLKTIMEDKIVPDSIVYVSAFKHCRINHAKLSADRKNHINGIENF